MRTLTTFLAVAVLLQPACSTISQSDLAKREDYLGAMALHAYGDHDGALQLLPTKEPGGFLTTAERGWLAVLAGKPVPEELVRVSRELDARKTLRVSREAAAYFYKETEEGYYPAEHEAVAFHVITGYAFAASGRRAEALVEAKRAALYLQNDFGSQSGFDHPALRLWLAGLWVYTGEWDSARVDLRRAAQMDPKLTWAGKLADEKTPPPALVLVLEGPGPDLDWDPSLIGDGAVDTIKFVPGAKGGKLRLGGTTLTAGLPTLGWYTRHQERDRAIRQVLTKSRYMIEGIAPAGVAATTMTLGVVAGVSLIGLGIAGGCAIVYYTVKGYLAIGGPDSREVGGLVLSAGILAGGAVAYGGIYAGTKLMANSKAMSETILDKGFNPTDSYRYMRFLPDHVHLAPVRTLKDDDMTLTTDDGGEFTPRLRLSSPDNRSQVFVYYVPGSRNDMAAMAKRASWLDTRHKRDWVLLGLPEMHDVGKALCASMNRRLPTWPEYLDARKAGLTRPEVNTRFGIRLTNAVELWTSSEASVVDGKCRVVAVKDGGEGTVPDCKTPRYVLCVATVAIEM